MSRKTPVNSLVRLLILTALTCLGANGCASSTSPILYKGENLTIQRTSPDEIIVHSGAKAVSSPVEESRGHSSRIKVFAPAENNQNVAVVLHGKNRTRYQAYAWPIDSSSPCKIEKNVERAEREVDVEWATPVVFSVVDRQNQNVHEVVAYDAQVPGWIQISPSSQILKVCPSEGSLIEGNYEAGSMQVFASRDEKNIFVFYNDEFYRIDLDIPIVRSLDGRVTVSPNGQIAILAIIDGVNSERFRLFAWSSLDAEPTKKSVDLGNDGEIAVQWLSNRSVSISSKTSDLKVIRYNLNRSWTELDPRKLP